MKIESRDIIFFIFKTPSSAVARFKEQGGRSTH